MTTSLPRISPTYQLGTKKAKNTTIMLPNPITYLAPLVLTHSWWLSFSHYKALSFSCLACESLLFWLLLCIANSELDLFGFIQMGCAYCYSVPTGSQVQKPAFSQVWYPGRPFVPRGSYRWVNAKVINQQQVWMLLSLRGVPQLFSHSLVSGFRYRIPFCSVFLVESGHLFPSLFVCCVLSPHICCMELVFVIRRIAAPGRCRCRLSMLIKPCQLCTASSSE